MSWLKLLRHDLGCGLVRWRYLLVPALVLFPCIACRSGAVLTAAPGTWMDYMLYCFKGAMPMNASSELVLALPTFWALAMAGCLLLNLDYLLSDLTQAGQQIIFRSGNRRGWYLSKCVWNLCSCGLYMTLICAAVLVFTLLSGGQASAQSTPEILEINFSELMTETALLTPGQGVIAAVLLPLMTLMALSMVQMTLCLLLKPILSFVASLAVLVLAVYCNLPWIPGTGAMVIRSGLLLPGGISPGMAALVAGGIILLSAGVGCLKFKYTDMLGLEE
ncbi:MAG TPA: hypothetical protein IAC21_04185 [Candidatus Enterenecus merdae]|nr:hypothetical protein [Candidatus Enterenecus merdae]